MSLYLQVLYKLKFTHNLHSKRKYWKLFFLLTDQDQTDFKHLLKGILKNVSAFTMILMSHLI